jgi:hypothetical protein
MTNTDVYIKDEGDFATFIFQTEKSINFVKGQSGFSEASLELLMKNTLELTGERVLKLNIDVQNISKMEKWLVDNNLICDSEYEN